MMLTCSRCKVEQPEEEFYKTTNYWHAKRGYTYVCRTCSRLSARISAAKKRKEVSNGANRTVN